MTKIEYHPLADIFPMMAPKDLMALSHDIAERGQREPIVVCDNMILDGRNRFKACEMAGVEPIFDDSPDPRDPLAFVVSANLHRRHLTDDQRAMVAEKIANLANGQNKALSIEPAVSIADAAAMLNVAPAAVKRVRKVRKDGASELVAAVEQGKVTISAAAGVAKLPIEKQQEIVAAGAVKATAKKMREKPKKLKPDDAL